MDEVGGASLGGLNDLWWQITKTENLIRVRRCTLEKNTQ